MDMQDVCGRHSVENSSGISRTAPYGATCTASHTAMTADCRAVRPVVSGGRGQSRRRTSRQGDSTPPDTTISRRLGEGKAAGAGSAATPSAAIMMEAVSYVLRTYFYPTSQVMRTT